MWRAYWTYTLERFLLQRPAGLDTEERAQTMNSLKSVQNNIRGDMCDLNDGIVQSYHATDETYLPKLLWCRTILPQ